MPHRDSKYTILVPLLLMLSLLLFPLLNQQQKKIIRAEYPASRHANTGFPEYDLLPQALKERMKQLQRQDSSGRYSFCYFFDNDDVNQRYYLTDAGHTIIAAMPVMNEEALALIEEKNLRDGGQGYTFSFDLSLFDENKEPAYNGAVDYILPDNKEQADFSKLRVSILKKEYPPWMDLHTEAFTDTANNNVHTLYHLSELDEAPHAIRGLDYFKKIVSDEITQQASFLLRELEGEVNVEFTIGSLAKSPQIIKGFSNRHDVDYTCYRIDGAIIRAINDSKVHWTSGKRKGKFVDTRIAMTFSFRKNKQEVLLSMSDLQEADSF